MDHDDKVDGLGKTDEDVHTEKNALFNYLFCHRNHPFTERSINNFMSYNLATLTLNKIIGDCNLK